MKLYNTLGRQKQAFEPQTTGQVSLYTCGPTVYDYAHIGNLRKFVFDDLLRRSLEVNGYNVAHVMNITDVGHLVSDADEGEDKLEKGALREQKTVWEVAKNYTEAFKADSTALNILPPNGYALRHDGYARATDFIAQQIEMVKSLLDGGFAYITTQAIYFDVTKLSDYGKLTGQSLKDKEVGVRSEVVTDPDKHHPYDFAVWFFTVGHFKDHSMHWPTPWGDGFPGWHLECSAIIHSTLGEPIDIHTGGIDHIGTHHTNEIAQTEAAFGVPLSNFWLHSEFVKVNGSKMSKSNGSFYTLKAITDRNIHPLAFRLLCLQAHYRSELNFTWESLEAAQSFLLNLYAWADLAFQTNLYPVVTAKQSNSLINEVLAALADDLESPKALAILSQFTDQSYVPTIELLKKLDSILALSLSGRSDVSNRVKTIISQRQQARDQKDFAKSDQIRQQLLQEGIEIDDTTNGPRWKRTKP